MSKRISDSGNLQFGYYCGYPITDIPDTYLTWILSDFDIDDEDDQVLYDVAVREKDRRITETHVDLRITDVDTENKIVTVEPIEDVVIVERANGDSQQDKE